MTGDVRQTTRDGTRRLRVRYALLTAALFAPLLYSFLAVRNVYPFAASTMMMSGGDPGRGATFYRLRGETVAGESIDLPPAQLTDALSWRHWSLVGAVVENKQFTIHSPNPANLMLADAAGGVERLPRAARLPELLRAWGGIYNSRLPEGSAKRLRAVRLDVYRWDGRAYEDYEHLVESWRAEL
ncbi:MAG: hypothetical protein JOZ96_08625 [Acidobacteria bacterium]|nr:hypothetical protein [Acidobacteriota bacterium]